MFNSIGTLLLPKPNREKAQYAAAKELGKTVAQCNFTEGTNLLGKKWVRAFHNEAGYSDTYYYG